MSEIFYDDTPTKPPQADDSRIFIGEEGKWDPDNPTRRTRSSADELTRHKEQLAKRKLEIHLAERLEAGEMTESEMTEIMALPMVSTFEAGMDRVLKSERYAQDGVAKVLVVGETLPDSTEEEGITILARQNAETNESAVMHSINTNLNSGLDSVTITHALNTTTIPLNIHKWALPIYRSLINERANITTIVTQENTAIGYLRNAISKVSEFGKRLSKSNGREKSIERTGNRVGNLELYASEEEVIERLKEAGLLPRDFQL